MSVKIVFLGASDTVTGSKYLVSFSVGSLLIDAGLFQGERVWREKNWEDPPFSLNGVKGVLLTHAHLDHTGILPRYVAKGLHCPVWCTSATRELSKLLLLDSGRLQEEEAEYRRERGRSRHNPPLPLYTEDEARESLELFRPIPWRKRIEVMPGVFATWHRAGHILGAASIVLEGEGKTITFSGDIGRYTTALLRDPESVPVGDLLLIESTYGDRLHAADDVEDRLGEVVNNTSRRGGAVVIPSFAVGRTQQLLFHLRSLKARKIIPDIPVLVDSPMATDATSIYLVHQTELGGEAEKIIKAGHEPFSLPKLRFIRDRSESMQLNKIHAPMVIISASGMLTGGRILHHLKHRISSPANTILFVGFQPEGSRGAWIKSGASSVKLIGEEYTIKADIEEISGLSAHGDRDELLRWAHSVTGKPEQVAVVHGEPESARVFSKLLKEKLDWTASPAHFKQEIIL